MKDSLDKTLARYYLMKNCAISNRSRSIHLTVYATRGYEHPPTSLMSGYVVLSQQPNPSLYTKALCETSASQLSRNRVHIRTGNDMNPACALCRQTPEHLTSAISPNSAATGIGFGY